MRQVLWNLTGNAVKFTEQGGITIRVLVYPVEQQRVMLHIEVEDTGIGIPRGELENIFAMYYQVGSNKHAVGTGIGLAVSRQLIESMGGHILVDSEPGEGSCFTLELEVV